jgi:hypothetical protein
MSSFPRIQNAATHYSTFSAARSRFALVTGSSDPSAQQGKQRVNAKPLWASRIVWPSRSSTAKKLPTFE